MTRWNFMRAVVVIGAVIVGFLFSDRSSRSGPGPGRQAAGHVLAKVTERYYADRLIFASLRQLAGWSSVVAQVKVVKDFRSYRLPLDPPVANTSPQPPLNQTGSWKATKAGAPVPPSGPQSADMGPLKTDYQVLVLSVIKGSGITPGQLLTITAAGGHDASGVGVEEGNPLPKIGQEEIMFLYDNTLERGAYVLTGGPQGRYMVVNGAVEAVDTGGPIARENNRKALSDFIAAVRAAVANPAR